MPPLQCDPPQWTAPLLLCRHHLYSKMPQEDRVQRCLALQHHTGVHLSFIRWIWAFLRNRHFRVLFNGSLSRTSWLVHGVPQGAVLSPMLFLFYINSFTLFESGVPLSFIRWIWPFLRNRQFRVLFNGSLSRTSWLVHGVPQGAVLSPMLFLFYINSVADVIPKAVLNSIFADNLTIWSSGHNKETAQRRVQEAVKRISSPGVAARRCSVATRVSSPSSRQRPVTPSGSRPST